MSNAEEKVHISNVSLLTMRYMEFFFYSAKHYNEPSGEVGIAKPPQSRQARWALRNHHKAVRRGGHCETTTKPSGEVGIAILDYFGGTPS